MKFLSRFLIFLEKIHAFFSFQISHCMLREDFVDGDIDLLHV
jgi:hypothetical protein